MQPAIRRPRRPIRANLPRGSLSARTLVERQIFWRARRMAITVRIKGRFRCRRSLAWAPRDDRLHRYLIDQLVFERRNEIEILSREPMRQD